MATAPYTPAIDLTGKMAQPGKMSMGTAMQPSMPVGVKGQAMGMQQAGVQVPIGALGQGVARPPLAGQATPTGGLIGNQMTRKTQ